MFNKLYDMGSLSIYTDDTTHNNSNKKVRFRIPLISPINNKNNKQQMINNNITINKQRNNDNSNKNNIIQPSIQTIQVEQQQSSLSLHDYIQYNDPVILTRDTYIVALCIGIIVFIIHNSTAYSSISGGDAGELAIVSYKLSIAHPPGYPLFTLFGYIFSRLLPLYIGHTAYRIVIFNLCCNSITAVLLFLLSVRLTHTYNNIHILYNIITPLIYLFSHTVWQYSTQVEVFPLNNLLCTALLYTALCYYQTNEYINQLQLQYKKDDNNNNNNHDNIIQQYKTKLLHISYIGSLSCGLALTNQHTTIFYVISIILFIIYNLYFIHNLLTIQSITYLTIFLITGLLPYIYLPIRSLYKPIDAWGNQSTFDGFITHLLRREYGTFQLAASDISSNNILYNKLIVYIKNASNELMLTNIVLSLIGITVILIYHNKSEKIFTILCIICYLLYTIIFHYLANLDQNNALFYGVTARFWQQCNLIICLFICNGLLYIIHMLAYTMQKIYKSVKQYKLYITLTISLLLSFIQITRNYTVLNHSRTDMFYLYGYKQLTIFPHNSLVLLNGDLNNNILKYIQQCENYRNDIKLIGLQQMTWPWFVESQSQYYTNITFPGQRYHPYQTNGFSIKQFLYANHKQYKDKTYLCGPFKEGDNSLILQSKPNIITLYEELPYGLCRRLIHKDIGLPRGKKLLNELKRGLKGLTIDELPVYNKHKHTHDTWESVVLNDQYDRLNHIASFVGYYAMKDNNDKSMLLYLAMQLYDKLSNKTSQLIAMNKLQPETYRSAGVVYGMYSQIVYNNDSNNIDLYNNITYKMYDVWSKYVELKHDDNDIKQYVVNKLNPYTGQKIDL